MQNLIDRKKVKKSFLNWKKLFHSKTKKFRQFFVIEPWLKKNSGGDLTKKIQLKAFKISFFES